MSRGDRFELSSQLLETLSGWRDERLALLFGSFGILFEQDQWQNIDIAGAIASTSEQIIVEVYSTVMKVPQAEVLNSVMSGVDDSNWKPGYVRLFISHSAAHREFTGAVADELAVVGIHGFVAHEAMAVSRPWQLQIEHALRSMQAFVALVHPEFNESAWCHQEVGWALGRRVPHLVVRLGAVPSGFAGHDQWPSRLGDEPAAVAAEIAKWVHGQDGLGDAILDGLLEALSAAGDYYTAEAAAKRLVAIGDFSERAWDRLSEIYYENDQVGGSVLVNRVLRPHYSAHGRDYPPADLPPSTDSVPI